MSSVTWAGQQCIEPESALTACREQGLPTDWFGKPNSWSNVLGCRSGRGWILMTRKELDAAGTGTAHDLVFSLDGSEIAGIQSPTQTVTHKSLHAVTANCILPGMRADTTSCFLVELADRRRLLRAIPLDKAYNLPATPGTASDYFSATKNGGSAWTWTTMLTSIWNTIGTGNLGAFPGLPTSPSGTPEGFNFYGWYALDALEVVLESLGLALKLDTQTDTFSLVDLGSTDLVAEATLLLYDGLRIFDEEIQWNGGVNYPEYVRVLFRKSLSVPDGTGASPWYAVNVATGATASVSGTYAIVYADTAALYDSAGSLTNSASLATIAAERAADYIARLSTTRLRRVYGLPLSAFVPGSRIKMVRHGDRSKGMITEITCEPGLPTGDPGRGGEIRAVESSVWEAGGNPGPWINGGGMSGTPQIWNTSYIATVVQQYLSSGVWPIVVSNYLELCAAWYWCQYTVTQWTSDKDNFVIPSDEPLLRVTTDAPGYKLTGIVPTGPGGGDPGPRTLIITNVGDYPFAITNEDTSSTAINRFVTPTGSPVVLYPDRTVTVTYDTTLQRWVIPETTAPIVSPPQTVSTSSDIDDLALEYNNPLVVQITPGADINLTSMVAPPTDATQLVTIQNLDTTYAITVTSEDPGGTSGNTFLLPNSSSIRINPLDVMQFVYDPVNLFWVPLNFVPQPPRPLGLNIAANQNNLNPGPGLQQLLLNVTAVADLTGIKAALDGWLYYLYNVGSDILTLKNGSTSSSVGNRFDFSSGADYDLEPLSGLIIQYDGASAVWRDTGGTTAIAAAAASGGGGTTSTNGHAELGGSGYTVTSGYADTGLSVSLPGAGTFDVSAEVAGLLQVATAAGGDLFVKLYNSTDAADVTGSEKVVASAGVTGIPWRGTASIRRLITVAGAKTIKLYAKYTITGTLTAATLYGASSGFGETTMEYVQLA